MTSILRYAALAAICGACGRVADQGGRPAHVARSDGAPPTLASPGLVGGLAATVARADTAAARELADSLAAYERRRAARR